MSQWDSLEKQMMKYFLKNNNKCPKQQKICFLKNYILEKICRSQNAELLLSHIFQHFQSVLHLCLWVGIDEKNYFSSVVVIHALWHFGWHRPPAGVHLKRHSRTSMQTSQKRWLTAEECFVYVTDYVVVPFPNWVNIFLALCRHGPQFENYS